MHLITKVSQIAENAFNFCLIALILKKMHINFVVKVENEIFAPRNFFW